VPEEHPVLAHPERLVDPAQDLDVKWVGDIARDHAQQ
jgi:hypothetical protein